MRFRTLGRTGLKVSEIGYGAWGIGQTQWRGTTDDQSTAALERAIDLGLNFIDTALAYGDGHSEQLIASLPAAAKAKVLIATKIPPKNKRWPARPEIPIDDVFPYDYAIESTETSLRNLKVDTLDLQQFHVWNPAWLERDEWRRAIEDLKRSGKVRFMGISINDHQPDSALSIIETGLIDTVQVIYNIFDQTPANNLFPACLKHNIGVLARVPLDEGALTGSITEATEFEPGEFRHFYFKGDRKKQVVEKVTALKNDLEGVPGTLAEIALRFCITHPAVSTVIPGMRRLTTVESSCAVSDTGPLPAGIVTILKQHAWEKNFYQ